MGEKGSYGVKLVRGPFVELQPHPDAVEPFRIFVLWQESLIRHSQSTFLWYGRSKPRHRWLATPLFWVSTTTTMLATHRAYHPGLSVNWDLGDQATVESIGELARDLGVEIIAGGPSCQPFSKAGRSGLRELVRKGKRAAHDERSDLWQGFLRIVSIARPAAVLMENVPDMALDRDMLILRTMADELEHLGYSVETRVVDTWRYGVPQHRQRLILVALADSTQFDWPEERGPGHGQERHRICSG